MPVRISAIISDYDGTLCPMVSVKLKDNQIPQDLQNILWKISEKIPVCIISSKDFGFLRQRVQFAQIVACILGVEIFHIFQGFERTQYFIDTTRKGNTIMDGPGLLESPITEYKLSNTADLLKNSLFLSQLADMVLNNFQGVSVEYKLSYVDRILAAISIDYRHIKNWERYKSNVEPELKKAIVKYIDSVPPNDFYLQSYSDHPFLDVYPFKCDKGIVMQDIVRSLNLGNKGRIMYLGDSENDNPAFRKAEVSIGIQSDTRIRTKLDSDYLIEFNELRPFLQKLYSEDFVFDRISQNLL